MKTSQRLSAAAFLALAWCLAGCRGARLRNEESETKRIDAELEALDKRVTILETKLEK